MKGNSPTPGDMTAADQDDVAFSLTHPRGKEDLISRMLSDPRQCYFGQETVRWLFDNFREVRRQLHDLKAAPLHVPAAAAAAAAKPDPEPVKTTLERLADLVLANQQAGVACFISVPPAAPGDDVARLRAHLDDVLALLDSYDNSYSGRLESAEELASDLDAWRTRYEKETG